MSQRLPPLRSIRVFAAAARCLNFREAGEELHLTASAVSHQVRLLETHLGVALFDRTSRQIRLTRAGERYQRGVDQALAILEASTREVMDQSRSRPLRVSAAPIFVTRWLMPRLHEFYAEHPGLELSISPAMQAVSPHSPDIDLLIRYTDTPLREANVIEEVLLSPHLTPVCAPTLIADWRTGKPLPLHVGLLEDEAYPGHRWFNWFAAEPACPLRNRPVTGFETLTHLLTPTLDGYGVALQMVEMLDDLLERGQLERLYPDKAIEAGRRFLAIYPATSTRLGDITTLLEWIRERLAVN